MFILGSPVFGGRSKLVSSATAPTSPQDQDWWFDETRHILFFYDLANARWLAADYTYATVAVSDLVNPIAGAGTERGMNPELGDGLSIWWDKARLWYFISGTANYTFVVSADKAGTSLPIATFANFSASGAHTGVTQGINVTMDNTYPALTGGVTRNSGTGTVFSEVTLRGRLIG